MRGAPEERFWPKVRKSPEPGGCWQWTAYTTPDGYGMFGNGVKVVGAHRWAYENAHGPVPVGLELDHLCRNRSCVNPAHLEPVTRRENVLRGESPAAKCMRTGKCHKGHEMKGHNVIQNEHGRQCRKCVNVRMRMANLTPKQYAKKIAAGKEYSKRPEVHARLMAQQRIRRAAKKLKNNGDANA